MRVLAVSVALSLLGASALAGPLNPPAGPIASTHKTLSDIQPRVAVNSVNTPGDATAVFVISQPGSYYLTANLTGVSGQSGVRIAADGVTLDLNGFAVTGVPGALVGVGDPGSNSRNNICVRNGVVRNWPTAGVRFFKFGSSHGHRYEDLTLVSNGIGTGGAGLENRDNSLVINCVAEFNEGAGFVFADGNVLIGCVSRSNAIGFDLGFGNQITSCAARGNTGAGFTASTSQFTACSSSNNTGDGFISGTQSVLSACAANFNTGWGFNVSSSTRVSGCNAGSNSAGGVLANGACEVRECTVQTATIGIRASGSGCRVDGNAVVGGATGFDITGSGHFVVRNTCRGSTTKYAFAGTHTFGPVVVGTGVITTTSPWANFEH